MSDKDNQPLLDHEMEDDHSDLTIITRPGGRNRFLFISITMNALLLILCILLSSVIFYHSNVQAALTSSLDGNVAEPYSPANEVVEYEYRRMIGNDTLFTGRPGPEWERAMHTMMAGTLIRLSEDELDRIGSDSIPLRDGGYAAGLGVAHNLHCVKQLKQFIYHEHFYPGLESKKEQFDYLQSHADHCLDYLRQSIMCHLDFTVYTLYWDSQVQDKPTHREPGLQKCVNWNTLHAWMLKRQARTDMLVRPEDM